MGENNNNNNKSKDRRREPYRRMSGGARLHVTEACLLRMVHGISTSRTLCWREICVVLVIIERHIEKYLIFILFLYSSGGVDGELEVDKVRRKGVVLLWKQGCGMCETKC
jgi:hypothetical protein